MQRNLLFESRSRIEGGRERRWGRMEIYPLSAATARPEYAYCPRKATVCALPRAPLCFILGP